MPDKEPDDFESILEHVYGKGHYIRFLFLMCSMTSLIAGFEVQSMIFMNYIPDHNCTDAMVETKAAEVLWLSQPNFNETPANNTRFTSSSDTMEQCWAKVVGPVDTLEVTCSNWTYASEPMRRTVASQFNLVCDKAKWIPWLESGYLISNAIGFVIASVGDVIGRRKPFLGFVLLEICTCLATPFANSVGLLLFLRCLRGLSFALGYLGINLVSELVPIQRRAVYGNIYWLLWGVGYISCSGIAYLTRDWIQLKLWSCLFLISYLAFPFILCESPRWLCLHGRPEEASRVLKRVARLNAAQLSDAYFTKMDAFLKRESSKPHNHLRDAGRDWLKSDGPMRNDSAIDLILRPNIRTRCIVFCFVHSAVTIVYFGLITRSSFATDDIFLNVFLMGLIELPTSLAGWAVCVHCGRRWSLILLLTLTALCVGLTECGSLVHPAVRALTAMTGKFFLSVAYCVSDLYIAELFPTTIRTSSFFTVTTVAGLFAALAPFVNSLSRVARFIPVVIYCLTSVAGALLVYVFMPETRDCPLAQTVHQSEQLVRGKEREWIDMMQKSRSGDVIIRGAPIEISRNV